MYYLYHVNSLTYIEVRDGMSFGRNSGTKLFPDDNKMSGEHCRISSNEEGIYVEDLNSKNRTILDRAELPPLKKIAMKLESLLEVGSQRFILTDQNLSIQDVNDIINRSSELHVVKLEAAKLIHEMNDKIILELEKLVQSESQIVSQIIEKKVKISDYQKAIVNLAKSVELELMEIEEAKKRLQNSVIEKGQMMQNEIFNLTSDIENLQGQATKFKEEIEAKKKKIKGS